MHMDALQWQIGLLFFFFPAQVSLVSFLQRISLQKSRQSERTLGGQTDNVCIRSKITQSTIKITKKAAESTNMSCSLKTSFNRESKWIKERMCYSLFCLFENIIKKVKYKKPIGKLCTFKIILLQVTMCTTEVLSLIKVKSCL